jgi:hypothetical protein
MTTCREVRFLDEDEDAGEGIMSGLDANRIAEPVSPTKVENKNPVLDRSMIYHRTGLTSARVREACNVEAQGSFLYSMSVNFRLETYIL